MTVEVEAHARVEYGPRMAESLVAVRDRRDQAIARISEAYAQDLFAVLTGQEPPAYGRIAVR